MGDPNPRRDEGELQYGGEGRPQRDSCVPGQGTTRVKKVMGPQGGGFLRVLK